MTMIFQRSDLLDIADRRVAFAGLTPIRSGRSLEYPAGPPRITLGTRLEQHRCEEEPLVSVPTFIVLPLQKVYRIDDMRTYSVEATVIPYVVEGAIMTHFDWQQPEGDYRPATFLEIVNAMAWYPQYGSFRTVLRKHSVFCPVIEACFWLGGNIVNLHASPRISWGFEHHKLWIPIRNVPHCSSTRDLVQVRS